MNENNKVTLSGTVAERFKFSHRSFGEDFYTTKVSTERTSGVKDAIRVIVSERLVDVLEDATGKLAQIEGRFASYNKPNGERKKLVLNVFAESFTLADGFSYDENSIVLNGFLCKEPSYRETPLGRKICDLLVAVNGGYGKSDYLPVICWGRTAEWAGKTLGVGSRVKISGRIQSREYMKRFEDGTSEVRTAYEVSARTVEELKEDV